MNRYPMPSLESLPADLQARILEVQEKAGFVPNVFLALARRPAEWRAFFAYHDALMLKEDSGLTKGEREMIVTTTSAANCTPTASVTRTFGTSPPSPPFLGCPTAWPALAA